MAADFDVRLINSLIKDGGILRFLSRSDPSK